MHYSPPSAIHLTLHAYVRKITARVVCCGISIRETYDAAAFCMYFHGIPITNYPKRRIWYGQPVKGLAHALHTCKQLTKYTTYRTAAFSGLHANDILYCVLAKIKYRNGFINQTSSIFAKIRQTPRNIKE